MNGLPSFEELERKSDQTGHPVTIAAAGGADETVLIAMKQAAERGWINPVVCGNQSAIEQLCDELQIDHGIYTILDSAQPAVTAVAEVTQGRAAAVMKGQIPTPDLMRAILDKEHGLRIGRVICQMVLMEIPRDRKSFLLTDTGITLEPKLDQKQDLLSHLFETARDLGCAVPRIAMMAATEKVNEAMPETLDVAPLVSFSRDTFGDECQVAGPLSFDLAYASQAGSRKQLDNEVIGQADGMLFPNLLSANLTVKAIMYTADCRFGGLLCGTSAPVVFMSRADDVVTRMNSLALTLEILRQRG